LEYERQQLLAVEAAAEALRLAREEEERLRKYDVISLYPLLFQAMRT
jgi:hypothetical protein